MVKNTVLKKDFAIEITDTSSLLKKVGKIEKNTLDHYYGK